jgi:hypothetical protein
MTMVSEEWPLPPLLPAGWLITTIGTMITASTDRATSA